MMFKIYDVLVADSKVTEHFGSRIHFFQYPEIGSVKVPYIVISEIDEMVDEDFGNNNPISESQLIDVDMFVPESNNYSAFHVSKDMSYYIRDLLRNNLGITNVSNSKPEYDKEIGIYRRSRRFEGVFYRPNLN